MPNSHVISLFIDEKIRFYTPKGARQRYMNTRTLVAPYVGWSILDCALSPDGRHVVYSTWNEHILQCDLSKPDDEISWQSLRITQRDAHRFVVIILA